MHTYIIVHVRLGLTHTCMYTHIYIHTHYIMYTGYLYIHCMYIYIYIYTSGLDSIQASNLVLELEGNTLYTACYAHIVCIVTM